MFWTCKLLAFGLYLSTFLYETHSFVLLTANVEDLKRIAQKFVSDSLADKIARFIIEAADNNIEIDTANVTKNLSEYNDEFDVEKRDIKPHYSGEFRQKSETNAKQEHKKIKTTNSTVKTIPKTEEIQKDNKKAMKKKKQLKTKNKPKKTNKIALEPSSLEYYRTNKQLDKINPHLMMDLEKIHESDDSSITSIKQSRKELNKLESYEKSDEAHFNSDNLNSNIHKYTENDHYVVNEHKKEASENISDDFNYKLDTKSGELSISKTNLTTEIERKEFDQYFNKNYPKAEVLATSGLVELTKTNKKGSSDSDYE